MRTRKSADEISQRIAGLLKDLDDHDIARLRRAIRDLAFGVVRLQEGSKPGKNERALTLFDEEGNEYPCYISEPDIQMIRFMVEQNIGRAGTKLADSFDPEIRVYTTIPGFGEYDPNAPAPPVAGSLGKSQAPFIYGVSEDDGLPTATPDGRTDGGIPS